MSVPVNERSHGKLEACVKAKELSAYTLRITVNPKIFKPEYQHALTDKGVKIMQIIINKGMSPKDHARLDNAQASAQRNADLIEYLAMMADVEIPTDEEEAEDE